MSLKMGGVSGFSRPGTESVGRREIKINKFFVLPKRSTMSGKIIWFERGWILITDNFNFHPNKITREKLVFTEPEYTAYLLKTEK